MRKVRLCFVALALMVAAMLMAVFPAAAQDAATSGPMVFHQTNHDVSLPLWLMAGAPKPGPGEVNILIPENRGQEVFVAAPTVHDPVADDPVAAGQPDVPTVGLLNFDGISESQSLCNCIPPDTEGVVGATQFVQYVNTAYEIYDKTTGAKVLGPLAGNSLWSGFGGQCQANDDGDPIVMYDKAAQRWVFAQNVFATPYAVCIAVSTTSDATGSYNRYSYNLGSINFPDYPKWGVWPDGYYQSFNNFQNGVSLTGSEVCAADRNNMLAGNAAPNFICFTKPTGSQTAIQANVLPSDLDGNTAPPQGAPNYYLGLASQTRNLNIFQFHTDFSNTNNATFTGPTLITTAAFNEPCPTASHNACIVQPTGGELLEALTDRLMYRLNYRNFGTYESLLVTHTVKPATGASTVAAARWYEIRSPGSSPTVFQQGSVQFTSLASLWMGSIAQDKNGDIALGVSATGTILDPSVIYYGRVPTDTLGKMESPKLVVKGAGVQQSGTGRWGDYSLMSVDPTDDCTFWYTQEYIKTTGFVWHTRINSFRFASCS